MPTRLTFASALVVVAAACSPNAGSTGAPASPAGYSSMQQPPQSQGQLESGPTGLLAGFYPKTRAWSPLQHANRGQGLLSLSPQFKGAMVPGGVSAPPQGALPPVTPPTTAPTLPTDTSQRVGGDSVPLPNPHRDSVPVPYNRVDTTGSR